MKDNTTQIKNIRIQNFLALRGINPIHGNTYKVTRKLIDLIDLYDIQSFFGKKPFQP